MKRSPGSDLQRAIEFLSSSDLAKGRQGPLPARPDYEFLARHASEHDHDLSPGAVEEAFRLIMRARLVALRKLSHAAGDDRAYLARDRPLSTRKIGKL
jgi:hypothetical protein